MLDNSPSARLGVRRRGAGPLFPLRVGNPLIEPGVRIELMRFLQAGDQDLIALEPEHEVVRNIASEAGYQCTIQEEERQLVVQVKPRSAKASIRLFDASDPANLGWFSQCQFYVDGLSGSVLQTPLALANCRDGQGRLLPMLRISVSKEMPASFRLPGRRPVNEQLVLRTVPYFSGGSS